MGKSIVNKIFKSVKKSVILMSCLFFYTHYGDYIQGTKGSGTFAPRQCRCPYDRGMPSRPRAGCVRRVRSAHRGPRKHRAWSYTASVREATSRSAA